MEAIAPTKSNLLSLRRQLVFAEEGYDLLEQKRQILVFELMSRLKRARETEDRVGVSLHSSFAALREATLDLGSDAIDRLVPGMAQHCEVKLSEQHLMGLHIPRITAEFSPENATFGVSGTSANTDHAVRRFRELLPCLIELAELDTAVRRISNELRRTQRRCNALSKIFIPTLRKRIHYILSTLEERERESLVTMKIIRDNLAKAGN
ncbi:MAG: V-type ATP synthase subunit D [Victivallales bacterium]|jgi:V/A-type H+-transporting ATPase subunit D